MEERSKSGPKPLSLAAGGLENARILLLQDALQPGGLGNQHDMVGRCFMDHPQIKLGTLIPASSAVIGQSRFYDQHDVGGQAVIFQLHVRPEVMRREKMLNLCAVLVPHFKNLRAHGADRPASAAGPSTALSLAALFARASLQSPDRPGSHPVRSVAVCSKTTIRRVVVAGRS